MVNQSRMTGGDIKELDVEDLERLGYGCFQIVTKPVIGVYSTLDGVINRNDGGASWTSVSNFSVINDIKTRPDLKFVLFRNYLEQNNLYLANVSWARDDLVYGDVYRPMLVSFEE